MRHEPQRRIDARRGVLLCVCCGAVNRISGKQNIHMYITYLHHIRIFCSLFLSVDSALCDGKVVRMMLMWPFVCCSVCSIWTVPHRITSRESLRADHCGRICEAIAFHIRWWPITTPHMHKVRRLSGKLYTARQWWWRRQRRRRECGKRTVINWRHLSARRLDDARCLVWISNSRQLHRMHCDEWCGSFCLRAPFKSLIARTQKRCEID